MEGASGRCEMDAVGIDSVRRVACGWMRICTWRLASGGCANVPRRANTRGTPRRQRRCAAACRRAFLQWPGTQSASFRDFFPRGGEREESTVTILLQGSLQASCNGAGGGLTTLSGFRKQNELLISSGTVSVHVSPLSNLYRALVRAVLFAPRVVSVPACGVQMRCMWLELGVHALEALGGVLRAERRFGV